MTYLRLWRFGRRRPCSCALPGRGEQTSWTTDTPFRRRSQRPSQWSQAVSTAPDRCCPVTHTRPASLSTRNSLSDLETRYVFSVLYDSATMPNLHDRPSVLTDAVNWQTDRQTDRQIARPLHWVGVDGGNSWGRPAPSAPLWRVLADLVRRRHTASQHDDTWTLCGHTRQCVWHNDHDSHWQHHADKLAESAVSLAPAMLVSWFSACWLANHCRAMTFHLACDSFTSALPCYLCTWTNLRRSDAGYISGGLTVWTSWIEISRMHASYYLNILSLPFFIQLSNDLHRFLWIVNSV